MENSSRVIEADRLVVRFSGDSGDGMQLTGTLFSHATAMHGSDISTFPDYPADIRAPKGSVSGVSGYQVHFGKGVATPGELTDVLVAMNPAALKVNARYMAPGGTIIIDIDNYNERYLHLAGYETPDPISEEKLQGLNVIKAPITTLTKEAVKELGLSEKSTSKSKNMFALGLVYWLFNRPLEETQTLIREKFRKDPASMEGNLRVLQAGYDYGNIIQVLTPSFHVTTGEMPKGFYRNINGNKAVAWGFILAAEKSGLELFLGSYPITPATEILQELSERKDVGVKVFQAEDEIAAICAAIGASYAGSLAVTTTSGPGLALKAEAIGLAVMAELPLVIVNVQRGGPSTGLPTKTEQADLMQCLYGRNGESPLVVMAASTPVNCFDFAFHAAKIAVEHMIPVILLTDGFLANGTQQWKVPGGNDFPSIEKARVKQPPGKYNPYQRDEVKFRREWACPGQKGYEHRVGSLEKDSLTGHVSHDGPNHEKMVKLRQRKLDAIENFIPLVKIEGNPEAKLLVVGWGGTYGHLITAVEQLNKSGYPVALAHFNYINPLPKNSSEILDQFEKVLVCELNMGQFASYLRVKHPGRLYHQYNKVQGQPFTLKELTDEIIKHLET